MANQRFAAANVLAAAFCLPVVPAAAAALPGIADRPSAYDASAETAHQARGWAASRDDDGYNSGYAAPRARDDRYDDDPRWSAPDDRQTESYPAGRRALGLDRVADLCVSVVERERDRVNAVEGLARDANGWSVSGSLYDGSGFSCRIGTDGQLQDVHFGRAPAPVALTAPAAPARLEPQAQPEPAVQPERREPAELAAPPASLAPAPARANEGMSASAPSQPEVAPAANLAAASAAQDESAYRVAKLPPPPEIPRADAIAGNRELPAQPAAPANLAAPSAPAPEAAAAPKPDAADQAPADDDSGPLPPADTSEARAVDPNQSPIAVNPAQPKDDGRYSASQAPDFGQTV